MNITSDSDEITPRASRNKATTSPAICLVTFMVFVFSVIWGSGVITNPDAGRYQLHTIRANMR